ncbi:MAG: hypothetical protein A2413_02780 [Treponema sp. RIFOXYC1_FULL_61_9]|nr:MAG: hypothetical protein A2413_02780 [Treponema sp. RIFOXYC1_FULL_61_9]
MAGFKQKISFVLLGVVISISSGTTSESDLTAKVSKLEPEGYRTFSGFNFEEYTPSTNGLKKRVEAEVAYVISQDSTEGTKYAGTYSIVGHSQGGLRVLAYANQLKNKSAVEYNRLDGIITVSGIDRGLLALDGGFGTLKARFNTDTNIIWRGFRAGVGVFDIGSTGILSGAPRQIGDVSLLLSNFLPGEFRAYVKHALSDASEDSLAEIRDMMPGSTFIKENVANNKEFTYRVITGTASGWRLVQISTIFGKAWVPVYLTWNTYAYYSAYMDVPVFSNDIPVGYIVGLNNNTLSIMDPAAENDIRKKVSDMKDAFAKIQDIHFWKCVGIIGMFSGSAQYGYDAGQAKKWMANFDGELNELKGSGENDGLVAKESQYYPKKFTDPNTGEKLDVHTNVLGKTSEGYVGFPYNHRQIWEEAADVESKYKEMVIEARTARVRK